MKYAPVMISTYSRLKHLKRTVSSLKKNLLAKHTHLFIYSDAPKEGDEQKVQVLRRYLQTVSGFAEVNIIERTSNGRVANNRGGISELLDTYGRMIFLEDDIETAPGFLTFMNKALNQYETDPSILSVSGYLPALELTTPDLHAVALNRFCGWGVGFWKDKYNAIQPIPMREYESLCHDKDKVNLLKADYGDDLLNRFKAEATGHLNGMDTRASYHQFVHGMVSAFPSQSLVYNAGNDGSGVHCSINNKYDVTLWGKTTNFDLPLPLKLDREINRKAVDFYRPDNRDMSTEIVENIIMQLESHSIKQVTLWGTDVMTEIFLQHLGTRGFVVDAIADSWPSEAQFQGYPLLTPLEAVKNGAKNLVIMSFASRHKMLKAARDAGIDVPIFYYQEKG